MSQEWKTTLAMYSLPYLTCSGPVVFQILEYLCNNIYTNRMGMDSKHKIHFLQYLSKYFVYGMYLAYIKPSAKELLFQLPGRQPVVVWPHHHS